MMIKDIPKDCDQLSIRDAVLICMLAEVGFMRG